MTEEEVLAIWLRLNAQPVLGPDDVRELLSRVPMEEIFRVPPRDLAGLSGLSLDAIERFRDCARGFDAASEFEACRRQGVGLLVSGRPGYPELLRSTADSPLVLYVRGNLDCAKGFPVAFVGSRTPTPYGRRMVQRLAGQAAASGHTVVSGLARGIDTEAHRSAIKESGVTWAVLGSGLGRVYPPENKALARSIEASGGAVISEFPLDAPPLGAHFPRRNRIVSGLSWAVVVIEGREHSGSLITARLGISQGREVFAVPGPADSPLSEAPHLLISQGARLARSLDDIQEELPPAARAGFRRVFQGHRSNEELAPEHQKILQYLGPDAYTLDELGNATGIDLSRLSHIICQLELADLVSSVPGQRYAKKGI
ncbi:MAG: DNA-protecting protein DprA [Elusimicrobia bacterium]|nr:DNA-protecting protein DprA [Elusimicrobiota bacterium]